MRRQERSPCARSRDSYTVSSPPVRILEEIRRLAGIPNASPNWSEKLLAQLGKLALLTQAFHQMEQLDAAMQEDIRQLIGWNLKEEEMLASGERVTDSWLLLGQAVEDIERGRAQRTWLLGTTTKRSALLLQFSFAGAPFSVHHPLGICQKADLVYWPGVQPQRRAGLAAAQRDRDGEPLAPP